jgi:GR25 family glycosyltransferase involved in LPS biosynthesis
MDSSIIPDFHNSRLADSKDYPNNDSIDWSWIDYVYCISLKDREDRAKQSEIEFQKAGLGKKVIFYRPVKDNSDFKRPGTRGCWNSHHTVAKHAYSQGAKYVLIIEDDVEFDQKQMTNQNVIKMKNFLFNNSSFNILYLGHWNIFALPTRNKNFIKVFSLTTHAYIVANDLLKNIAQNDYESIKINSYKRFFGISIDLYYMFFPSTYAIFPMLCYQRSSRTSNQRPNFISNFFTNLMLSNIFYMKLNQYLSIIYSYSLIILFLYLILKMLF